jgi:hypothetical protein
MRFEDVLVLPEKTTRALQQIKAKRMQWLPQPTLGLLVAAQRCCANSASPEKGCERR